MSQENVEIARQAYEAFSRQDVDAFVSICDPAIEFTSLILESEGQEFRGWEGVRAYFRELSEAFDEFSADIDEAVEFDDALAISGTFRAHGRESGVPVVQHMWLAGQIRAGKIVWWQMFRTRSEALEAAGLSG